MLSVGRVTRPGFVWTGFVPKNSSQIICQLSEKINSEFGCSEYISKCVWWFFFKPFNHLRVCLAAHLFLRCLSHRVQWHPIDSCQCLPNTLSHSNPAVAMNTTTVNSFMFQAENFKTKWNLIETNSNENGTVFDFIWTAINQDWNELLFGPVLFFPLYTFHTPTQK